MTHPVVTSSSHPRGNRKGGPVVAVAVAVVVLGLGAWWLSSSRTVKKPVSASAGGLSATTAKETSQAAPQAEKTQASKQSDRKRPAATKDAGTKGRLPSEKQQTTASSGKVSQSETTVAAGVPAPQPERKPSGLHHPTEQLLAMAISAQEGGGPVPPLPIAAGQDLDKELLVALTNDIVVYDDDDEKTVALKEQIAAAKFQLKEIMDEGGTVTEALLELQSYANENAKLRSETLAQYRKLLRENPDDPTAAEEYLKVVNEELVAAGYEPVTVPTNSPARNRRRRAKKQ